MFLNRYTETERENIFVLDSIKALLGLNYAKETPALSAANAENDSAVIPLCSKEALSYDTNMGLTLEKTVPQETKEPPKYKKDEKTNLPLQYNPTTKKYEPIFEPCMDYGLNQDEKGQIFIKMAGSGEKLPFEEAKNQRYAFHFEGQKLEGIDFSQNPDLIFHMRFSDKTFSSSCKMPEGYNPEKVIESGKNPGLNVRAIHEMGITGKGQKIAIVDSRLSPHKEYIDRLHYEEMPYSLKEGTETRHGSTVTSIAAGKNIGVAPEADIYYFAENVYQEDLQAKNRVAALKRIYEINQSLPPEERIKIVSISAPCNNMQGVPEMIEKLKEQGCTVFSVERFAQDFGYLRKTDAMGNPDDFENYEPFSYEESTNPIFVNSGDRTIASQWSDSDYRHDSKPAMSWSVPYVAGLYADALQIDNSLTFEEFVDAAHKTAHISEKEYTRSAKEDILGRGQMKVYQQIAAELFPDKTFEEVGANPNNVKVVTEIADKRYPGQVFEKYCLAQENDYIQEQIKTGIIDEELNYTNKNIEIIDAKALMEYLQAGKHRN